MYEDDGANVSSTSLLLTTGGAGAAGLNNNPNYMESNGSNWTNWTGESEDYLKSSPAVQVHIYILYAVIFTVGLVGNVLVVFVVAQNKAMQTVTNCYIANLALSDILLCVLAVPFTPLYFFLKEWIFGKILCHLVAYSQVSAIKVFPFPQIEFASSFQPSSSDGKDSRVRPFVIKRSFWDTISPGLLLLRQSRFHC